MKKRSSKNRNGEIKTAYSYALKDGTSMRQEAIEKRIKRFKQLYIDTDKHEQDVRKWIESGTRKKADIRRSLEGLDSKYQELVSLNDEFERKGISELKLFSEVSKSDKYVLVQLKDRIIELYDSAGIERKQINNKSNIYGKDIDLVTDIPGNIEMLGIESKRKNSSKKRKEKIRNFFNSKKLGRRMVSLLMAMSMAIFAGSELGDSKGHIDEKESNPYTDTNRENEKEKESFRETLYVQATEIMKQETIAQEETRSTEQLKQSEMKKEIVQTSEKQEEILAEDKENKDYLAKANTRYTEASDGTGNVGYFSKDTEVKVYNRALVKTDKDGNKKILETTKIGQTWEEYANENGIDYNEFRKYMNNNENIQKCISLQSIDGTKLYGWVLEDTLEKMGEMER